MLENFYTCIDCNSDGMRLEAHIRLHVDHPFYAGHFPEQPVVPGVCQLHIFSELAAMHLGKTVRCTSIRELKFLHPIVPEEGTLLQIALAFAPTPDGQVTVQGTISGEELVKTKIKATFV